MTYIRLVHDEATAKRAEQWATVDVVCPRHEDVLLVRWSLPTWDAELLSTAPLLGPKEEMQGYTFTHQGYVGTQEERDQARRLPVHFSDLPPAPGDRPHGLHKAMCPRPRCRFTIERRDDEMRHDLAPFFANAKVGHRLHLLVTDYDALLRATRRGRSSDLLQ